MQKRVRNDPAFRAQLLEEALNCFLAGDIDTGKSLLRDYLNATESTRDIADRISTNVKSLQRMVGPRGIRPRKICSSFSTRVRVTGV